MKRLGDEITIFKGRKAPEVYAISQKDAQRYIQIDDLRTDVFIRYARDPKGVIANEEDVLIAWDGANAGTIGFGLKGYIGSTIAILRFDSKRIFTPYLGYFLRSKFDYLQENATGATIPHISRRSLEDLELEIPSLLEQKRLAAILAKADRLRRLRRYALTVSDTYLQTVFSEMFGDPARNTKGWEVRKLGQHLTFLTSGSRGWAEYYANSGELFLRIQNIGKGRLLLNDIAYVQAPDSAESRRTKIQAGDLIFSITADLGRVAVIPERFPAAYINQHLALLRLKDVEPIFVAHYFTTPSGRAQITRLDREGVKSGLNFDDIRGLEFFVPPLPLQQKFAQIVQKHEQLRAQQREAARQSEGLFQALMHRAFRGELSEAALV